MTVAAVPVELTTSPIGVLHLTEPSEGVPDTLCQMPRRTPKGKSPWLTGSEIMNVSAVCLPCRLVRKRLAAGTDALGNAVAREGQDVCACGCKYWENDQCFDCGANWHPSFREED